MLEGQAKQRERAEKAPKDDEEIEAALLLQQQRDAGWACRDLRRRSAAGMPASALSCRQRGHCPSLKPENPMRASRVVQLLMPRDQSDIESSGHLVAAISIDVVRQACRSPSAPAAVTGCTLYAPQAG